MKRVRWNDKSKIHYVPQNCESRGCTEPNFDNDHSSDDDDTPSPSHLSTAKVEYTKSK